MYVPKAISVLVLAFNAAGCASVVSGTSQTLTLDTVPAGADCTLTRKGLSIGRVNPTPGAVLVQRTRDDITVSCTRDGYQTGTFVNKSGLEGATLGNIILGGLIGVAIDAASGANNKYDTTMRITLVPSAPGQEQPPQTQASTPTASVPAKVLAMAPAEFRCPSAGTKVQLSSGQLLAFTQADGMRCGYVDESGAQRQRYAILVDGFGRLARHDLDGLWPLNVGNRIDFRVLELNPTSLSTAWLNRDYEESFAVVRAEAVSVPAGTFDTFVIEWREKGTNTGARSEALITLWYAPRIGYFVKSSAKIVDRDPTDPLADSLYSGMDYEATTITMPSG
jgi:hypothetical protein